MVEPFRPQSGAFGGFLETLSPILATPRSLRVTAKLWNANGHHPEPDQSSWADVRSTWGPRQGLAREARTEAKSVEWNVDPCCAGRRRECIVPRSAARNLGMTETTIALAVIAPVVETGPGIAHLDPRNGDVPGSFRHPALRPPSSLTLPSVPNLRRPSPSEVFRLEHTPVCGFHGWPRRSLCNRGI